MGKSDTRQTAWILWAAMLSATFMYLVVLFLLAPPQDTSEIVTSGGLFTSPLTVVLTVAGSLIFIGALFLPRLLAGTSSSGTALPAGYLVRLAMFEGVSVLGLVVGLLEGMILNALPLWLMGVAGIVLSRPTATLLEALSRKDPE